MKKIMLTLAALMVSGAMYAQTPVDKEAAKAAKAALKAAEKQASSQLSSSLKLRDEVLLLYQANQAEADKEKKGEKSNTELVAKNKVSIKSKALEALTQLQTAFASGHLAEKKYFDGYKAMDDVASQLLNPELELAAKHESFDTLTFAKSIDGVCDGAYGTMTYGKANDELQKMPVAQAKLKMPKLHVYYAYLCMFYTETKNLEGAVAAYQKYKAFPTKYPSVANDPAVQSPQYPYAQFAFNIYLTAYNLQRYDVCAQFYDEASQYDNEQSHDFVVSSRPQIYLQKGDTVAWINSLKEMIAADPNSNRAEVATQNLLAHYSKSGAKAMEAFADEMLAKDPNNKIANYGKGYALVTANKFEEALKYYQKSIDADPNYVDGTYQCGFCYYQIGLENGRKIADKKYPSQAAADKDAEVKVKSYLRKALPYFERVRDLEPEKPARWASELKVIYTNLKMNDKLKELPTNY